MSNDIRNDLENIMPHRGDDTTVIAVVTQESMGLRKTHIAFVDDEMDGSAEYEQVHEVLDEIGGDVRVVSIFRWPQGTSDAKVLSDMSLQLNEALDLDYDAKLATPLRHCWGEPSGSVDEAFVCDIAPRIARCHEQAEMQWDKPLPSGFLLSVSQSGAFIEWGVSITVTPEKLIALTYDDHLLCAIDDASACHEREYGVVPKAIVQVAFLRRRNLREMAGTLSKVIRNVNQWSRPYADGLQMVYWLFD